MAKCALCQEVFTSKAKLVQHFGDAHSIARQRARRSKVTETIKHIASETEEKELVVLDEQEDICVITSTKQPLNCSGCDKLFATQASLQGHQCIAVGDKSKKQPVTCQYCGQKCKDRRGAAIHQAFCEKRTLDKMDVNDHEEANTSLSSLDTNPINLPMLYECPGDDCGAIFKNEDRLIKHIERHHTEEGISIIRGPVPSSEPQPQHMTVPQQSTQPPLVTVTMKPHIGKTEGLQDLSLLITPTKNVEEPQEFLDCDSKDSSVSRGKYEDTSTSITMEECRVSEGGTGGSSEAVLYVIEDGTAHKTSQKMCDGGPQTMKDETKTGKQLKCSICHEHLLNKDLLSAHMSKQHATSRELTDIKIKNEPIDFEEEIMEKMNVKNDDEDWEIIPHRRTKYSVGIKVEKGKLEYKCSLCKRHFLSELSFHTHVRNRECKNKKFKLPRMFSCHFKQCDSSFFKLTELQRHWQIAHKFSMASKNVEFDDERMFTDWLAEEEEKNKVRFTCDVKRRKPHRTERLLVCHRFHHLRTAAARKTAKREYSDRHNWIHKIQPCLCFARMKVYQDFNEETCDYTGKISVVYYFEHTHPINELQNGKEEILDHILQRNKRNRSTQFQDLKGNDKMLHRQKLEKLARIAGKEYRPSAKSAKVKNAFQRLKRNSESHTATNEDEDPLATVNAANNLMATEDLFSSHVEMVLDGQFDMGHEVLAGSVVTHLDNLPIFAGGRVEHSSYRDDEEGEDNDKSDSVEVAVESSLQAVLPASSADWGKLFEMVRTRITTENSSVLKAEAALVLPYEKLIDLVSPSEQIPIFRQLWELAYPDSQSQDCVQLEIRMMR